MGFIGTAHNIMVHTCTCTPPTKLNAGTVGGLCFLNKLYVQNVKSHNLQPKDPKIFYMEHNMILIMSPKKKEKLSALFD